MPKENKNLVVALDIGTSKVACLVSEMHADVVDLRYPNGFAVRTRG